MIDKIQIDGVIYDFNASKALLADNATMASTAELAKDSNMFAGQNIDYFAKASDLKSIPSLYSATFLVDNWNGNGPYYQTSRLVALNKGENVTQDYFFTSGPMCNQTSSEETNLALLETLNLFNLGYSQLGNGVVTSYVFEKPINDIEVIWAIKGE